MQPSAKIVDCIQPFAIFAKHFILFVSQGYDKTKQYLGVSFILQKIRTAISANLFLNSIFISYYYLAVIH